MEQQISAGEMADAMAFVRSLNVKRDGLLACPVSRLQVRFRLGYQRACALAAALEAGGFWEIVVTPSGMRGARLK